MKASDDRSTPVKRTTISDVAREAGVSIGTVSRVLNDARNVRPALRQRVLAAVATLSYRPDSLAQGMRSNKTRVIGVVVPSLQNPLSAEAMFGIEAELTRLGYTQFVASSRYDRAREKNILDEFVRRRVDGIIAILGRDDDPSMLDQVRALTTPLVLLEREIGEEFDAVRTDQVAGTYRATRYLISLGHRDIAFITVPATVMSGRDRYRGYEKAMADAGAAVREDLVAMGGFTRPYALDAAYTILSLRRPPSALIVSGGMLAGVLEATRQLNMAIPDDLSLISLGDTELAALMRPGITAIRYDWAETGRAAARLVVDRLDGRKAGIERIIVPYEFIRRESCLSRPPE